MACSDTTSGQRVTEIKLASAAAATTASQEHFWELANLEKLKNLGYHLGDLRLAATFGNLASQSLQSMHNNTTNNNFQQSLSVSSIDASTSNDQSKSSKGDKFELPDFTRLQVEPDKLKRKLHPLLQQPRKRRRRLIRRNANSLDTGSEEQSGKELCNFLTEFFNKENNTGGQENCTTKKNLDPKQKEQLASPCPDDIVPHLTI